MNMNNNNRAADREVVVSRKAIEVGSMAVEDGKNEDDARKTDEKGDKEEIVRFRNRQKPQRWMNSKDAGTEKMDKKEEEEEEKKEEKAELEQPTSPVEGRCECCPYGYHIDLDFLRYLSSLSNGSQLSQSDQKQMRLHKKKLRRSMEFFLHQQELVRKSLLLPGDDTDQQPTEPSTSTTDPLTAVDLDSSFKSSEAETVDADHLMEEFDRTIEVQLASMNQRTTTAGGVQATPAGSSSGHEEDALDRRFRTETEFMLSHPVKNTTTTTTTALDYDSCNSLSSGPSSPSCQFSPRLHHDPSKGSRETNPARPQRSKASLSSSHFANSMASLMQDTVGHSKGDDLVLHQSTKTEASAGQSSATNGQHTAADDESGITRIRSSTLQAIRQQMAVSLERMRDLEEQVKMIPVLQVRLSILKEEKRHLMEEMNASKLPPNNDVIDDTNKIKEFVDSKFGDQKKSVPSGSAHIRRPAPPPVPRRACRSVGVGDGNVLAEPSSVGTDCSVCGAHILLHERELKTQENTELKELERKTLFLGGNSLSQFLFSGEKASERPKLSPKPPFSRSISVGTDADFAVPSNFEVHEKELRTIYIGGEATTRHARAIRNVGIMCRAAMRDVGVMHLSDSQRPLMRSVGVGVGEMGVHVTCPDDLQSAAWATLTTDGNASESKRIHIRDDQLRTVLDEMLRKTVRSVAVQCSISTADKGVDACPIGLEVSEVGCGDDSVDVDVTPKRTMRSVGVENRPSVFHRACYTDEVPMADSATNTETAPRVTIDASTNTDRLESSSKAINTECPAKRNMSTSVEAFFLRNFHQEVGTNTDSAPRSSVATSTELTGDVEKTSQKPVSVSQSTSTSCSSLSVEHREVNTDPQTKEDKSTVTIGPTLLDRGCNTIKARLITASTSTNGVSCVSTAVRDLNSTSGVTDTERGDFKAEPDKEIGAQTRQRPAVAASTVPSAQRFGFDEFTEETLNTKRRTDDEFSGRMNATIKTSLATTTFPDNSSMPRSTAATERATEAVGLTSSSARTFARPTLEHVGARRRDFFPREQFGGESRTSAATKYESSPISSPSDAESPRLLSTDFGTTSSECSPGNESFVSESDDSASTQCSVILTGETPRTTNFSIDSYLVEHRQSFGDESRKVSDEVDDRLMDECGLRRIPHSSANGSHEPSDAKGLEIVANTNRLEAEAVSAVDAMWVTWQKGAFPTGSEATARSSSVPAGGWGTTIDRRSGANAFESERSDHGVTTTEFTLFSAIEESDGGDDVELPRTVQSRRRGRRCVTSATEMEPHFGLNDDRQNEGEEMERKVEEEKENSYTTSTIASNGHSLKSIMKSGRRDRTEKKELTFSEGIVNRYIPSETTPSDGDDPDSGSDGSRSSMSFDEGTYDSQLGQVVYPVQENDDARCFVDLDDFEDGADDAVFDQEGIAYSDRNLRDIYEMSEEMIAACTIYADWLEGKAVSEEQLNSSLAVIQSEWFSCSSQKLADPSHVEDYLTQVNEISQKLLENVVNSTDSSGNTALHYAISYRNIEVVNLILDTGACDVDKRNRAGYNAIMLASLLDIQTDRQRDVIRRLFDLGDVNQTALQAGQTALMLGVSHGDVNVVRMLLEAGAKVNVQDEDGSTALMCASEHGHFDIVKLLLAQEDCDASIVDNDGSTAVSIAMENGHKEIGILLYAHLNFKPSSPPKKGIVL